MAVGVEHNSIRGLNIMPGSVHCPKYDVLRSIKVCRFCKHFTNHDEENNRIICNWRKGFSKTP
jgi:hypothetical protein